jgi:hypothetical protein
MRGNPNRAATYWLAASASTSALHGRTSERRVADEGRDAVSVRAADRRLRRIPRIVVTEVDAEDQRRQIVGLGQGHARNFPSRTNRETKDRHLGTRDNP